jgi:hypothetical protein
MAKLRPFQNRKFAALFDLWRIGNSMEKSPIFAAMPLDNGFVLGLDRRLTANEHSIWGVFHEENTVVGYRLYARLSHVCCSACLCAER